jgi:succinate-acetate transporter protein
MTVTHAPAVPAQAQAQSETLIEGAAPATTAPATTAPADTATAPAAAARGSHIADPAPLGLAAFALTFVLSFVNTGLFKVEPVVFGLALAYGGVAQMGAGMWEFAKGNTFGATAFTSYGAFWLSFWYLNTQADLSGGTASQVGNSIGLFLLAWGVFTLYMTVAASRVSSAVFAVFVLLTITFGFLAWGEFAASDTIHHIGGWFGLATAAAAWYASFGGLTAFTHGKSLVPTGPR